jgi:hypothetical protein
MSAQLCVPLNRDDSVIADFFSYSPVRPESLRWNGSSGRILESRFVHQHQHVDGAAIVSFRRRNETEAVRKCHSDGQDFFQFKNTLVNIEGKLVATPFGVSITTFRRSLSAAKDFRLTEFSKLLLWFTLLLLIRSPSCSPRRIEQACQ